VGDIGDFGKYALLRKLSAGRRLGIAWCLYPDEQQKSDGKFIEYLNKPEEWRQLDPELFDGLRKLVHSPNNSLRSVAAVEASGLFPGADFASIRLETDLPPSAWQERRKWRKNWFRKVMDTLSKCDLVFADPDNGLCHDKRWRGSKQDHWKRLPLEEAKKLCRNGKRTTVLYHHNTRSKGGHRKEIQDWMERLPGCSHAFYWRRYSNRTYFVVNADREIVGRLDEFAHEWKSAGELIWLY